MTSFERIQTWCNQEIDLIVEDRYEDTGEIIIQISDDMESAKASLTLEDLIEFRRKIDKTIEACKRRILK